MARKKFDDDIIKQIDEEMGWIEEDGSSPSKTAKDLGYHCKFLDGPFSAMAWVGPDGVWSISVLGGKIPTTILAKSFEAAENLYRKLRNRCNDLKDWKPYYKKLWQTRYLKWCCTKELSCNCMLCRMASSTKLS